MTYLTVAPARVGSRSPATHLSHLVLKLRARLSRHLVYRATRARLSSLSDHQLDDIGLHRGLINEMADKLADRA